MTVLPAFTGRTSCDSAKDALLFDASERNNLRISREKKSRSQSRSVKDEFILDDLKLHDAPVVKILRIRIIVSGLQFIPMDNVPCKGKLPFESRGDEPFAVAL